MNKKLSILTVCTFGVFGSMSAQHQPQLGKSPINEIISAMTIDEKVALLVGFGDEDTPDSIPSATIGFTKKIVPGAAGITHAIPRLGIPSIVLADGPAGLRIDPKRPGTDNTFYCTHFPVATSLASTWNAPLVKSVGNAIGNETLEYGVDILLAPATNIMRNPLCGRNFEYYSEDPILAGKLTSAMIQGIQQNGVGTSLKHFALNNQETNRTGNNVLVSPYVMRELYLKPFEIAIRESTPWTVMSSYKKVNGEYASENSLLLDSILRRQWGYKGLVMTDWFGGQDAVKQTIAGNDLLMPGLKKQYKVLKDAVDNGKLSTHILDRSVQRILELIIKTPRFQQYDYTNTVDLVANARTSRMAAAEGMVLLKNDNLTLPLDKSQTSRIALFGISSYDFIPGGTGSGDVNRAYTISLAEGLKQAGFQWNEKLAELYDTYIKKETDALPERQFDDPVQRIAEMELSDTLIQAQASCQDMAVITIGRISGEFHDRNITDDFLLSQTEQKLIENVCTAFHQKGKKVIVILNTCGVLETFSWKEQPDAILVAWLAGQEGGNAVTDILTGTVTPSGKLPMTWPVNYEDVPSASNFPLAGHKESIDSTRYEEGLFVGYRYYDTFGKPVSYPFGYGLSYTTFDYGNLSIEKKEDVVEISCRIINSGNRAGKEVVQVYVSFPDKNENYPTKELKGFAKTQILQPGETETVTVHIPLSYLKRYDETADCWKLPQGIFRFFVNSSVKDCRLTGKYNL